MPKPKIPPVWNPTDNFGQAFLFCPMTMSSTPIEGEHPHTHTEKMRRIHRQQMTLNHLLPLCPIPHADAQWMCGM